MIEPIHGFPLPPAAQVTLANWRLPPFSRWAFHHVRDLIASADIDNDPDDVWKLSADPIEFSGLQIEAPVNRVLSFDEFLKETDTDSAVILKGGRIVLETYASDMSRETPHILMSVSKSLLGLLAGILVAQKRLDPGSYVVDLIPELADTAYRGATIRHLLDMTAAVDFVEDYLATSGPVIAYRKATNWNPLEPGEPAGDLRSFYSQLTGTLGDHGRQFNYVSPNTDLLGWVIERVTGESYARLVSNLLWRPMGASCAAYVTVDRLGAPRCAGGICATTRDLALLGQLMVQMGSRDDRQIVPRDWIEDIVKNGDREVWKAGTFSQSFPDVSMRYRSKWYVQDDDGPIVFALGIHGQHLIVDFAHDIVIAKYSSQALPLDIPKINLSLRAALQIRKFLIGA